MPRPKKPGAPEPKRRSRNGCCCQRSGEACDYSIRLNWEGRRSKKGGDGFGVIQFDQASSQSDKSTPSSKLATSPSTSGFKAVNFGPPSTVKRPAAKSSQAWSSEIASGPLYVPVSAATAFPTTRYDFQSQISFAPNNDNTHSSGTLHPSHDAGLERMDMPGPPSKRLKYSLGGSEGDDPSFQSMAAPYHPRSSETHVAPDHLAPSAFHDDFHQMHAHPTPEAFRRLSVNSLLSGDSVPSQEERLREATGSYLGLDSKVNRLQKSTYYGIDRGFTDLDVGVNDDLNAITGASPKLSRREIVGEEDAEEEHPTEFGFGAYSNEVDGFAGGYYDRPVIVRIPQTFEPLPDKLRDNPMNLLYFHHFLNHTSRVLVPHDDPGSNPFRTVLPLMAVTNDHLLSLLLAYSASHRARLLQQPEPATRIALWVQDIFPALRHALDNPDTEISSTDVATAIMLASLEIICPSAFEVHIPWQKHLTLARELVTARPALLKVNHHSSREAQAQGHQVCAFLWSWFAYLDVLGSLSGGGQDASPVWVLEYRVYHPDDDDEIDCIMGFTTCCIYILARIAELAKKSDTERLRAQSRRVTGQGAIRDDGAQNETDAIEDNALSTWQPSAEAQAKAHKLEADVRESLAQPPRPCQHIHNLNTWDRREMIATNEAYHWAALIHLWRRVWGAPTEDARVQEAVGKIFDCLRKVRRCGSAEGCLLFPMFTAGCETRDAENREYILERMKTVEKTGMTQVSRARRLMERVWEVGQPWETLLSTEFIG